MEFKQNTVTFYSEPLGREVALAAKSFLYKDTNIEFWDSLFDEWSLIIDRHKRAEVSIKISCKENANDRINYGSSYFTVEETKQHLHNVQIALELIENKTGLIPFLKQAFENYESERDAYKALCKEKEAIK
jgi:hypothetical protein